MHNVKAIQKLNEEELKLNISGDASWHAKYKDSAYVFVGGLNYDMNEGDIIQVMSQCGEIVDCNLIRDKDTGKSKGFAFIAYEDQRSTILAVDNFNGITLCGRMIKVDHVNDYRVGKEYLQVDEETEIKNLYTPSGPEGKGWGKFRRLNEEELKKHEERTEKLVYDEDEKWEKEFMKNNEKKHKKHREKEHKKKHHKHREKEHIRNEKSKKKHSED
ncbi:unnamed protein product [Blepharisma stoltei]|uniref:RRM domain-containing protein n=1 Tax=Blepharisma stoltei TaxID=1481888 RepID=A0AAU9JA14_9CILI|nr:unnamed protein product [Blepharisma stoltei]